MRSIHRLTASAIKSLTEPGYHPDGAGLILQVTPSGSKSWLYCYGLHGRKREMGLGPFPAITLAQAREKAADARKLKASGIDPLGQKQHARKVARAALAKRLAVAEAATKYIDLQKSGWSDANTHAWRRGFELHANPIIGRLDVSEIDTTHVLKVLEPIWTKKHATATLLRQRIESVLDWAKSAGYREGENPARWSGHLENLMPAVGEAIEHRAALAWREMPGFMAKLRAVDGNLARLMEFLVLTGVRAGEASGGVWGEIDADAKVWRIPAARMKGRKATKRAHDVPLCDAALALLEALPGARGAEALVFPSGTGRAHWDADLAGLLRKLGYALGTVTTHGMRSSLRTFLTERLKVDADIAESVLAHDKRGAVQKAYERTRHFDARVMLMQAWADYLREPAAKVLPLGTVFREPLEAAHAM
ncbi:phage integrase [Caballeronia arationis]|uniref:tyrosine-type recombinase/integrase n=1 Tax=Caballeronia arationis TaxID=1777142 RepID=UPI00074BCAD5|nr:integrase arm-type DNA-binding domain-containing protein [Caballeronia arationis]SAK77780.1 phage integrase [Caballeronia arationis]